MFSPQWWHEQAIKGWIIGVPAALVALCFLFVNGGAYCTGILLLFPLLPCALVIAKDMRNRQRAEAEAQERLASLPDPQIAAPPPMQHEGNSHFEAVEPRYE